MALEIQDFCTKISTYSEKKPQIFTNSEKNRTLINLLFASRKYPMVNLYIEPFNNNNTNRPKEVYNWFIERDRPILTGFNLNFCYQWAYG